MAAGGDPVVARDPSTHELAQQLKDGLNRRQDAEHEQWRSFTPDHVAGTAKSLGLLQLLGFSRGSLPNEWNRLVDEGQPVEDAKILHWSSGIPGFDHYRDAPGAKLWWDFAIYWSFHCPYYFDKAHQAPLDEAAERLMRLYGARSAGRGFNLAPVVIVAYSGGYLSAAYALDRGGANHRVRGVVLMDVTCAHRSRKLHRKQ